MDERVSLRKSVDTTKSSVYARILLSFGSSLAAFTVALISSIEAGVFSRHVRSTTDTLGTGTRNAIPVSSIQFRDNLPYSLRSPGGRWDDVLEGTSTIAPLFARRAIDSLLGGCYSVDSCHESLFNSKFVIDDLCQWCKAVSSARSVAEDVDARFVFILIYTADKHRRIS